MDRNFDAVLFDWRGTLVATSTPEAWVREALRRLGRHAQDERVAELVALLDGAEDTLDRPGVDCDADLHRDTYRTAFRELGIDVELTEALYAVESDPCHDRFAADAADVLGSLRDAGLRIAVVSDIHVDIRPAFAAEGLADLVDVFTLSFEQGTQKPDPRMFTRTALALGTEPVDALVVGDRSGPDGAALDAGLTTLLLPPLTGPRDRRLHHVRAICGLR